MTENENRAGSIADEFHALGKSLAQVLRTAWDNQERKRIQDEVVSGINELGTAIKNEVEALSESPTGQQLKADITDLGERIRTGETQAKVQQELLIVLRSANAELQKVIDRFSVPGSEQNAPTPEGEDEAG